MKIHVELLRFNALGNIADAPNGHLAALRYRCI
jgi:hypothetical protein